MKLQESGTTLASDMGVSVCPKMWESIEALIQASLKTAQDLDGGPFPAYPSGKSWDEASGKTGSVKKFYHNVISGADFAAQPYCVAIVETLSEQQLVDCNTVDSACNDELMNNSFAFDKKRMPSARRPVTVTLVSQPRAFARVRIATLSSLREVSQIQGRVYRKRANSNDDSGTATRVYRH